MSLLVANRIEDLDTTVETEIEFLRCNWKRRRKTAREWLQEWEKGGKEWVLGLSGRVFFSFRITFEWKITSNDVVTSHFLFLFFFLKRNSSKELIVYLVHHIFMLHGFSPSLLYLVFKIPHLFLYLQKNLCHYFPSRIWPKKCYVRVKYFMKSKMV